MLVFAVHLVVLLILCVYAVCEGKPTSCANNEFPCNDGSCVDKSKWCDTKEDCLDGSDEHYCFTRMLLRPNPNRCDESFFLCKDGRCIPIVGRCDGYASCSDFSDEEDCGTTVLINETNVPLYEFTTIPTDVKSHKIESPVTTPEVSTHSEISLEHDNLKADSSQNSNERLEALEHYNGTKSNMKVSQNISEIDDALKHLKPHDHAVKLDTGTSGDTSRSRETIDYVNPYDVVVKEDMNDFLNINESNDASEHLSSYEHYVNVGTSTSQNASESREEHLKFNDYSVKYNKSGSENAREINYAYQHQNPYDNVVKDGNTFLNITENDGLQRLKSREPSDTAHESVSRKFNESNKAKEHLKPQDSLKEDSWIPQNKSQGDDSSKHNHYDVLKWHNKAPSQYKIPQEEDLKQKFLNLIPNDFRLQRTNAQKWLLKVRDENYGWNDETARAITALYMSNDDLMIKQSDKLLMSNQLNLKLFAALIKNETKRISLGELAHFINALSASCDNPKNFYGKDLVNILRQRTDVARKAGIVVPLVYLVLCLNNATSKTDIEKLQKFVLEAENIDKIGIEATASLALTCMHRSWKFPSSQPQISTRLLKKIQNEELSENIYDLALMAQALNEARINQDLWNRSEIMNRIKASQKPDGSFGDILSTYYVMPLLSGRSLLSLNQHCQLGEDEGLVPVEVLKDFKNEKWEITYILRFGNPPELSQILQLNVKKFTNFFDIMRISETINPAYKFKYVMRRGIPSVYSIGGVINDAEKGHYWSLHLGLRYQQNITGEILKPFEGDIRSLIPSEDQYAVFWMKPVF